MTPTLPFDAPTTLAGKLAAYLQARPGVWIDGLELARVAGSYAWRSRCSDLRRAPYEMTVENRQRKVHGKTISEYRYVPVPTPCRAQSVTPRKSEAVQNRTVQNKTGGRSAA